MIDEQKIAGASYILNFYRDVYFLTHYTCVYLNILLELDNKYPTEESRKVITDEERAAMLNTMQNVRYYGRTAYIQYLTIQKKIGKIREADHDKITLCYDRIKEEYIIKKDVLDEYTQELNNVLVNDMIQNILESNQDLISSMLSGGSSESGKEKTKNPV